MTGHGHDDHAPKQGSSIIVIAILAVFVVLALLVFFGARGDDEKRNSHQTTTLTQTVKRAAVTNRSVQGAVTCPSVSPEKEKCSFDAVPTDGFGSTVAGLHFCYDKPYGPNELYSRDRWDASQRKWVEWTRSEDPGVVYQQRLRANVPGTTVTVTYWLSTSEACTA